MYTNSQGNMHPSFPYESGRSRGGGDYGSGLGGVRGRGDVLVQSHPGLEDSLVLHNALSSVVEEAQVSVVCFFFFRPSRFRAVTYSSDFKNSRKRQKKKNRVTGKTSSGGCEQKLKMKRFF